MSQEETLGLTNGLAAVAKEQNASNKSRTEELKSLASAVKDLSDLINLQDFNYPTLMALIEAAKRYETKTTSIAVDEPISTANALPVTPVPAYPRKAPAHSQEATPKPSETLVDSTLSSESLYSTTVVIHSNKESAILPLNVSIGNIRPVLSTDTNVLEDAADFTASQVANQWYSLVSATHAARRNIDALPTLDPDKIVNGGHAIHTSNLQEMAQDNLAFDSSFLSPYLECHPHGRQDLLNLRHATSGQDWSHPVNVEKIVVVPDTTPSDISPLATVEHVDSSQESVTPVHPASPNKDLADVAFRLGTFLEYIIEAIMGGGSGLTGKGLLSSPGSGPLGMRILEGILKQSRAYKGFRGIWEWTGEFWRRQGDLEGDREIRGQEHLKRTWASGRGQECLEGNIDIWQGTRASWRGLNIWERTGVSRRGEGKFLEKDKKIWREHGHLAQDTGI
eukprot:gene15709-7003_t